MRLRIDPISAIVLSIILGWGWYKINDRPICTVHEIHDGKTVEVPYYCEDVLKQ